MDMTSVKQEEIDRKLFPAAQEPERFEVLTEELVKRLDEEGRDLELRTSSSWRSAGTGPSRSSTGSFLNQFRCDVERIETLDREEEACLARRIEFARKRLERAWREAGMGAEDPASFVPLLPADEPNGLPQVQADDLPPKVARRCLELHSLRAELVERNLYLVLINVERYAYAGVSKVDLIQEGCLSLFRAVDGFDWRRGLLFRTYAVHWLNQAFRNHLYNHGNTVRVPVYLQKALKHIRRARIRLGDPDATASEIAGEADMSSSLVETALFASRPSYSLDANSRSEQDGSRLGDLLQAEEPKDGPYTTRLESVSLEEGLGRAMEKLSQREALVLQQRFGVGVPRAHTLAEVAGKLGVSVERVRQIQVRALSKLKTPGLRRQLDPWIN